MSARRERAAAQLLHRPAPMGPQAVVERLLAVQAQDLRAARLALRARITGLTVADVDAALERGELVVAWLNRGTLHLVGRDDYPWLLALTAPTRMGANRRRLAEEGVTPGDAERAGRSSSPPSPTRARSPDRSSPTASPRKGSARRARRRHTC